MEGTTSGIGQSMLAAMRGLARRGAALRRAGDGSGVIECMGGARAARLVTPPEFKLMLDAGWLRPAHNGAHMVLSRRGTAVLRNMLNQPVAAPDCEVAPLPPPPAQPAKSPVSSQRPAVNDRESPLAWLRQRRDKDGKPMIGDNEYLAGEQLRTDFERAQLGPRVTASWDPTAGSSRQPRGAPGLGLEMAEGVVAARQRVDAALKAVGPELSGLLLDVCCFLQGLEQAERNRDWPRRSGKIVLQLALAHLARHYGFDRRSPGNGREASRILSWGAPDYRPTIDGDDNG